MPESYLSQYFSGVALKTLTAVEANTAASNQHEYNGNTDLRRLFGRATAKHRFRARFVYVSDEKQEGITDEAPVTWYDARQNHPKRSEHRLYFPTTRVSRRATAGDLLVIGMLRDNSVLVVIAKDGSRIATDLRRLFGVTTTKDERFSLWQKEGGLKDDEARSLLQTVGVLDRVATPISSTSEKPAERTAIVVMSLPSDYEAVTGQLRDVSEQADEQGTLFEVGRYDSAVGIWEIAIVRVGLGTLYAASTVDQAIQRFLPEVVVLLGTAIGVRDGIAVGDVVVASAIYSWDTRPIEPRNFERQASSHRVLQRAIKEGSGDAWLTRRRQGAAEGESPKVIIAPIASTTNLVAAPHELRASRAIAVDMGDASLLGALDRRDGIEVFVVRGIASLDQTNRIGDTKLASENATAFAFQVLSMLEPGLVADRGSTKSLAIREDGPSCITRFRIHSIKSIQAIDWEVATAISAGWHVLVGINASGKTTALRCIALALLGSNKETHVFEENWATWVRQGAASGDVLVALTTVGTSDDESDFSPFSPDRATVVAPGIVLIDEIDVHLHPKWQQEIGAWFTSHFPKFQFIVATHSLFVCQSAVSVFILPDPGETGAGRMLTDVELNQIKYGTVLDGYGTGVFGEGVDESERSRDLSQELATLNLKQLREGLTPGERNRQTQLRAILPTSDLLCEPAVEE